MSYRVNEKDLVEEGGQRPRTEEAECGAFEHLPVEVLTQGYEVLQRQVQAMETAPAFQLPEGVQNGLLLQQNIDLVQENGRLRQESVEAELRFERMERRLDALERRLAAQELTLREERALRAGMRQRIDRQADEVVISPPQSPARPLRHGSPVPLFVLEELPEPEPASPSPPGTPRHQAPAVAPLLPARQPAPEPQQNPPQQAPGVSPELLQRLRLTADKPDQVAVNLSKVLFTAEERMDTCIAKMDIRKVNELEEHLFATCQTPRGQRKQIWSKAKQSKPSTPTPGTLGRNERWPDSLRKNERRGTCVEGPMEEQRDNCCDFCFNLLSTFSLY